MQLIDWTDDFDTGITDIDKDHRLIISYINELTAKDAAQGKLTQEFVNKLVDYTTMHFAREEAILIKCGYPDLKAHLEEHLWFKDEVKTLCQDVIQSNGRLNETVHKALGNWWVHHILESDHAYVPFLSAKGIS
jgi:hemerythrin-like metal-binding protein